MTCCPEKLLMHTHLSLLGNDLLILKAKHVLSISSMKPLWNQTGCALSFNGGNIEMFGIVPR